MSEDSPSAGTAARWRFVRVKVYRTLPRPRWHWVCDICGADGEGFRYIGPWRRSPRRARRDGRKHVKRQHFPYHFGMTLGESENERKRRAERNATTR